MSGESVPVHIEAFWCGDIRQYSSGSGRYAVEGIQKCGGSSPGRDGSGDNGEDPG